MAFLAALSAALVLLLCLQSCSSFTISHAGHISEAPGLVRKRETSLFSTPPRQPRRNLKKRRRNKRRGEMRPADAKKQEPGDTVEIRPIVSSKSKEAGEDYWIDDEDLERSIQRKQAIQNRKAMEGEIPKEKLWSEVFAPYKQNWIGIISMMFVILATIVTKFPELLNQPVIPIPDL